MTDRNDDFDDDEIIAEHDVPNPEPQALFALTLDPWPRSRSRDIQILVSVGMADEKQKSLVVPRQSNSHWHGFGRHFRDRPCYELWTDRKLTGLASTKLSATSFGDRSLRITAELAAIFLRARQRGLGLCRVLCSEIADSLYRQILTIILRCPVDLRTTIHITVSAELYSEGGQAAISIICDELCPRLEQLEYSLETPGEVLAITDAW